MRVGNTSVNESSSLNSLEQQRSTQPAAPPVAQPVERSVQNAPAPTGPNVRASQRQAESSVGSSLQEGRIRDVSSSMVRLDTLMQDPVSTMAKPAPAPFTSRDNAAAGPSISKTAAPNSAINDFKATASTIDVTDEGQLENLNLDLSIAHSYPGDLEIKLKSPSGKEVTVFNRQGGRGTGVELTAKDLSAEFAGEQIKGQWTLTVNDKAALDKGTLKTWGLNLKPKAPIELPPTNLQVIGDAAFIRRVAQDLDKFAPGTTVDAKGYVREAANKVAGHDQGYLLINNLLNGGKKVSIDFTANNAFTASGAGATVDTQKRPGVGSDAKVSYDPSLKIDLPTVQSNGTIKNEPIDSAVVLAHELIHASHAQKGTIDRSQVEHTFKDGDKTYKETWRYEEFRTTGFPGQRQGNEPTENSIRAELGFNARATYLDKSSWVPVNTPTPEPVSQMKLYKMPDLGATPVVETINNATKTIDLEIYQLGHQGVVDALKNAAARGVQVRVMLEPEPVGTSNYNEMKAELSAAGVQVKETPPEFSKGNAVDHAKFMIIDGKKLIYSTGNFKQSSLGEIPEGRAQANRDFVVEDNREVSVQEASLLFQKDWDRESTRGIEFKNLVVTPDNGNQKIFDLIDNATKTLYVANQSITNQEMVDKLIAAAQRGVEVHVMAAANAGAIEINPEGGFKQISNKKNLENLEKIRQAGGTVTAYNKNYLHAKYIVADNKAFVGSQNFTGGGLGPNREFGQIFDDPTLVKQLVDTYKDDEINFRFDTGSGR